MKTRSEAQPASYSGLRYVISREKWRPERQAGNLLLSSEEMELYRVARSRLTHFKWS